jgi:ankyrin repeat protein
MSELTTKQYLLHKLAFFGGSSEDPATEKLNQTLLDMFPAAVHKFDRDGNVPLHLAAASGNLKMIMLLGEKFASGASIRNEDGMLPLHFAIASYGEIHGDSYGDDQGDSDDKPSPLRLVKTVLKFFPNAVAIPDNDGNLPIHIAVECLEGALGVDVVYLLLDEADRQVQDPFGARFSNKTKVEEFGDETGSTITLSTEHEVDSSVNADERIVHCSMVRNNMGETPLTTAIKTRNGWEMIEAIAGGPGGKRAALYQDADQNNALHLLVGSEYQDPVAALSILKAAPETASMRNAEGMLPIEVRIVHECSLFLRLIFQHVL